jgi:hypothetical protein
VREKYCWLVAYKPSEQADTCYLIMFMPGGLSLVPRENNMGLSYISTVKSFI